VEVSDDARRRIRLKEQIHLLKGDLDWIVMKALEKDRTRRYETANGLASDIQRHLSNEPSPRPPSNLYRFQKLVRRNKTAFAAMGAVAAALVAGLGCRCLCSPGTARAHPSRGAKSGGAVAATGGRGRAIGKSSRKPAPVGQDQWDEAEKIMSQTPPHPAAPRSTMCWAWFTPGGDNGRRQFRTTRSHCVSSDGHLAYHYWRLARLLR